MKRREIVAFELLKNLIITKYNGKPAAGGKEVVKRCHYCGDSKNMSSRHMYIGISKNNIIVYNCFKCGAHGAVGPDFFRDIGEYDDNVTMDAVLEYNKDAIKTSSSTPSYRYLPQNNNGFKPILNYDVNEVNQKKLDYINNRLGLSLQYDDLARLKIVLDLRRYLIENHIKEITRAQDIVDVMSFGFIGFLTINNTHLVMRRLLKEQSVPDAIKSRYTNYNIYGREDSWKFYAIPVLLDMSKHITIHIAEGPFDILGIYRDHQNDYPNSIWIAVCGKGYIGILKSIIAGLGLIDFEIHIYPDNDFSDQDCLKVFNFIKFINCGFYIHRNIFPGEKDFGVSADKIKETTRIIRK